MSKVFKKLLGLGLVCTIALSAAACGSSGKTSSSDGSTSGQSATPDNNKYTINYVISQAVEPDAQGELVKKWNEKYNVEFKITNLDPQHTNDLLNLKIASGEIPDVFVTNTASMISYQQQGALAEIPEDYVTKYLPKVSKEMEAEAAGVIKYGMLDGKRYGVPNSFSPYNEMRRPIVYNGTWMKKVGVTKAPENITELETLLYKFAQEDPDGNGKKDTYGMSNTALSVIYGSFSTDRSIWLDKAGKAEYSSIQPEMKNALQLLNKWYKDGIIDPQFITGENTGGYWAITTQAFINGRIGLTGMGSFYHWNPAVPGRQEGQNLTELKKANADLSNNLVYGTPIKGTDGKGGINQPRVELDRLLVFGSQLSKDTGKLIRILNIADDMCGSVDNYINYFYGTEGTDWQKNTDGSYKFITNSNDLMKKGGWGTFNFFGTIKNTSAPEAKLMDWGKQNKFDQDGFRTILSPFAVIPSIPKYKADLDKLENIAFISMITGEKPLSYFDEFVKQWKAQGGDTIAKEVNDWYQANKAKK